MWGGGGARAPGAPQREPHVHRTPPSCLIQGCLVHSRVLDPLPASMAGCPPRGGLYLIPEAENRWGRGGEVSTVRMKAPIGPRACFPCLCPVPADRQPWACQPQEETPSPA